MFVLVLKVFLYALDTDSGYHDSPIAHAKGAEYTPSLLAYLHILVFSPGRSSEHSGQ